VQLRSAKIQRQGKYAEKVHEFAGKGGKILKGIHDLSAEKIIQRTKGGKKSKRKKRFHRVGGKKKFSVDFVKKKKKKPLPKGIYITKIRGRRGGSPKFGGGRRGENNWGGERENPEL